MPRGFAGRGAEEHRAGVRYHIARALLAGGQAPRAMDHFRQARQIDSNGKYAALAEAALSKFAIQS